jgi:16S rRNA U516 pseudouridylate synthase RsuA-like enzyme
MLKLKPSSGLSSIAVTTSSILIFMFLFFSKPIQSFHSRSLFASRQTVQSKSTAVWSNDSKQQRLERIISNRGIGSRNDVSKLFKQGRVSVNGKVIRSGADKYSTDVVVEIDGQSITGVPLLAIFHKPTGVHSTMKDNWGRQGLEELALEYPFMKAMHPVGRLDADTSGLLLFSSDGHLTQMLLHPSTGVEREYEAIVAGTVDMAVLGPRLASGVTTADGDFAANLLSSEALSEVHPLSCIFYCCVLRSQLNAIVITP